MKKGKHTWLFTTEPVIAERAVIGGPFEKESPLVESFDFLFSDFWAGEKTFELAHSSMMKHCIDLLLQKSNKEWENIDAIIMGDLLNQIAASSFSIRNIPVSYLGLFSACATSMEGLALASLMIDSNNATSIITGTGSHYNAIEKQFRYPTEYGTQKALTAQCTVTGAGYVLVKQNNGETDCVVTTSATIGKVVDMGLKDPVNMGGAMAPAAIDTILTHFEDLEIKDPNYYDLIITGDLGKYGREVTYRLLHEKGLKIEENRLKDAGVLIYDERNKEAKAGGSGAACSAVVTYGYIINQLLKGRYKKVLVVATGALLSQITAAQGESIPCIAHAVSLEYRG